LSFWSKIKQLFFPEQVRIDGKKKLRHKKQTSVYFEPIYGNNDSCLPKKNIFLAQICVAVDGVKNIF